MESRSHSGRTSVPCRRLLITVVALAVVAAVLSGCSRGGEQVKSTATTSTAAPATSAPQTASTVTTTTPPTTVAADAGTWSLVPAGAVAPTRPVAWTGQEVLVAEMGCCGELGTVDLMAYNPTTATWRNLSAPPLTPRTAAAGAWTGREMVIAGGVAAPDRDAARGVPATDAAAWNGATNTWHRIAAVPAALPAGVDPVTVWTGSEVLVWSMPVNPRVGRETVLAYNPDLDRWRTLPASGLAPREYPVAVWTGTELVVWGGLSPDFTGYADGARLDPATGRWRRLPPAPVPGRGMSVAVWSGSEVLLWGGMSGPGTRVGQGAAYDPARDVWRALPLSPLRAKSQAAGVWTGRFFIVVGGSAGPDFPVPGPGAAAYDPVADRWTALPAAPRYPPVPYPMTTTADQRADGLAVWTGRALVLVGGLDFQMQASRPDGLAWTPRA